MNPTCAHCGKEFTGNESVFGGNQLTVARGERGVFCERCIGPLTVEEYQKEIRNCLYYAQEHHAQADRERESARTYERRMHKLAKEMVQLAEKEEGAS